VEHHVAEALCLTQSTTPLAGHCSAAAWFAGAQPTAIDPSFHGRLVVSAAVLPICPLTACAWRLGSLPLTELWAQYLFLGGTAGLDALGAYLQGATFWSASEHNVLAHALNERLWDLGLHDLAPIRKARE